MSDPYTEARTEHGALGMWGHVPYAEAVTSLRRHLEHERDNAVLALAELDAGRVRVWQMRGPYARQGKEITPQNVDT